MAKQNRTESQTMVHKALNRNKRERTRVARIGKQITEKRFER
jgi:hypothetical protein